MGDPMRTSCVLEPETISRLTGGRWDRDVGNLFRGVALDSRIAEPGDLFIALEGSSSDGHNFISNAIEHGSTGVMISSRKLWGSAMVPTLLVTDTLRGLHDLASGCRNGFKGRVIAITGSVGKTTVKEMTSAILRQEGSTIATAGNFNNTTGVPLSVLRMCTTASFAVIEIGMSAAGEIRYLVPVVRPHTAGILNVKPVHLENFKNLTEIAKAKAEIMEGIEPGGTVVLNADDRLVRGLHPPGDTHIILFGRYPRARLRLGREYESTVTYQRFEMIWDDQSYEVCLFAPGMHNRMNSAASAALSLGTGCSMESVIRGLKEYRPGMMRSKLWKTGDGSIVLEDCYNSSPSALSAAINALTHLPVTGRRVLVMGDMLELGSAEISYHSKAGEEAAAKGITCIVGFGPLTTHAVSAFRQKQSHGIGISTTDIVDAWEALYSTHRKGDVILIKGSRGMAMERLVENIREEWGLYDVGNDR